eukprot:1154577-Pelagomonas_calceolata.AAC.8
MKCPPRGEALEPMRLGSDLLGLLSNQTAKLLRTPTHPLASRWAAELHQTGRNLWANPPFGSPIQVVQQQLQQRWSKLDCAAACLAGPMPIVGECAAPTHLWVGIAQALAACLLLVAFSPCTFNTWVESLAQMLQRTGSALDAGPWGAGTLTQLTL